MEIGQGAFGSVSLLTSVTTKNNEAIKTLKMYHTDVDESYMVETTLRELYVLNWFSRYPHPNLIDLLSATITYNEQQGISHVRLHLDYMPYNLQTYMNAGNNMTPKYIQMFTLQLLSGVSHMHSCGLLHADLKPQNIIVCLEGRLKIIDYGLTVASNTNKRPTDSTTYTVTRWFRPPELLLGNPEFSDKVDVWSVSLILIQMASVDCDNKHTCLLRGSDTNDQLLQIFRNIDCPRLEVIAEIASPAIICPTILSAINTAIHNGFSDVPRHGVGRIFNHNSFTHVPNKRKKCLAVDRPGNIIDEIVIKLGIYGLVIDPKYRPTIKDMLAAVSDKIHDTFDVIAHNTCSEQFPVQILAELPTTRVQMYHHLLQNSKVMPLTNISLECVSR